MPAEQVAIAARRKRIKVMLSQVRWPEISLSKRLGELITLCEESIEVCALVSEFLDESPVIGGSEIDPVTTAWSGTG